MNELSVEDEEREEERGRKRHSFIYTMDDKEETIPLTDRRPQTGYEKVYSDFG